MPQRYKRNDYAFENFASAVAVLYALYLASLWFTNKPRFYRWIIYNILVIIGIVIGIFVWRELQARRRKQKLSTLLTQVRQTGTEPDIDNFINSFGYQKKTEKNIWREGEYSFTWSQLDTLRRTLKEKGIGISLKDFKDISLLLRHYIHEKEERFIRESIHAKNTYTFSTLTGTEFENLLYRLYTAMGYSVMKTGKTGDQGCDLVVNMDQERVVIQAKRYTGSVPNAAIQQAIGALKIYNCTKAYVITNSYFTTEAIQLAKVNNVGLVSGERLRELLLQYLKENWT